MEALPDHVLERIGQCLCTTHPMFRQHPELKRDAIALIRASKTTRVIGKVVLDFSACHPNRAEWLSLSEVSKKYMLKPADRVGIPTLVEFVGYGRQRWPVTSWSRHAVVVRALRKYGGEDGFAREKARLERGREKRSAAANRKRAERTRELTALLQEAGCTLRDDSRLCKAYVERGEGDPHDIACTMREMKFYHEETTYVDDYDEIRREELRYKGWYHSDEVSDDAKHQALYNWVMRWPNVEHAADRPELPPSLREAVLRGSRRGAIL